MSQNRTMNDREGVVKGLRERGDEAAIEVADIVANELARSRTSE